MYPNAQDANLEKGSAPAPWLACVRLPPKHALLRDSICHELEGRGVETRPFFYPVHTMPPYRQYRMVRCPCAHVCAYRHRWTRGHSSVLVTRCRRIGSTAWRGAVAGGLVCRLYMYILYMYT